MTRGDSTRDDTDPFFEDMHERARLARAAFSPSAPISRRDLFAGRVDELVTVLDVVAETGQHAILYGERGVGKTSLATVATDALQASASPAVAVRVPCDGRDTYGSVWRKAFNEIHLTRMYQAPGFTGTAGPVTTPMSVDLPPDKKINADHVRHLLRSISTIAPVVIFFDEFDRIDDPGIHLAFADTIKSLSDQAIAATIVVVGVADDVNDLITEHASIERALVQVPMPRMSEHELAEIVDRGLTSVEMTITAAARARITSLSQGLPHFTHLLAQQAAVAAVWDQSRTVGTAHVQMAVQEAVARTQESISDLYDRATYSARENLYKQVLLACACARSDDRGFFAAASVRETLSKILERRVEIPQFAMHLSAFSNDRGPVLRKVGTTKLFRYRFVNPLMQPYVIMRGIKEDMISVDLLESLGP